MPLPVTVIAELLGVPGEDRERFGAWSAAMARASDPGFRLPPDVAERAAAARREFIAYFPRPCRRAPGDDLLSALVAVSDEREMLSEGELLVTLTLLLVAGHETTTNLIGDGVLALLRHPEQYAVLAADGTLAEQAVEEILRYDSPIQLIIRTALTSTTLGNVELDAGDSALVFLDAARPPRTPGAPTRSTSRGRRNDTWRSGTAFTTASARRRPGSKAARWCGNARSAPALRLAGAPEWAATVTLRGLSSLPVTAGVRDGQRTVMEAAGLDPASFRSCLSPGSSRNAASSPTAKAARGS